jgi:small-conductance mechanosensitive channel
MDTIKEILEFELISIKGYTLTLLNLIIAILILVGSNLAFYLVIRPVLKRFYKKRKLDTGRRYAINQMVKYIIYLAAILFAIDALGVQLSILWAGGAALLAGIALGMQNTFADLIGGVILLMEGTVEVGDIVMTDDTVGTIKTIGLRTSQIETRDQVTKIVPNSKLVSEYVINWSTSGKLARFYVSVGVTYSSDVNLVTDLLIRAAKEHRDVLQAPRPKVMFRDFGNSSLDFHLYFYSSELLTIEVIKSEIRYRILELFREHDVVIPFPQRDLWLRNPGDLPGAGGAGDFHEK